MTRTKIVLLGLVGLSVLAFGAGARAQEADPNALAKTLWACTATCAQEDLKKELEYTSCANNSDTAEKDAVTACDDFFKREGREAGFGTMGVSCENKATSCQ